MQEITGLLNSYFVCPITLAEKSKFLFYFSCIIQAVTLLYDMM